MKKLLLYLLVLYSTVSPAQLKYNWFNQIYGYNGTGYSIATFGGTTTDTIKASASGLFLKSIAGSPGFQFEAIDTSSIANFYLKVRGLLSGGYGITYSGTTGIIKVDTTSITGTSYKMGLKLNVADTAAMLTNYVQDADITNMVEFSDTVSVIATQYDLSLISGGSVDTLTEIATKNDILNMLEWSDTTTTIATAFDISTKVNYSDTAAMLSHFVEYGDTASMLSHYVEYADTLTTIATKSNVALKLAIADTATMLTSYVNAANAPITKSGHTISVDTTSSVSLATAYDLTLKQDVLVSGTNIKSVNSTSLLGSGNLVVREYWITVNTLSGTVTSGATRYFGSSLRVAGSTATEAKITFRTSGTITIADLVFNAMATAGSGENISIYIRLNNTTDYLVATVGSTSAIRVFSNTGMSVPIVANDFIEMKIVTPSWATPPTSVVISGNLIFTGN